MLSLRNKCIFRSSGFLLLTVCPLLFPKIGEQQYSYVQGLCFLSLSWLALAFQMQKRKQTMVVRSMDIAVGVCLLALLLHVFWIKPVSLPVWRWVDAVGLFVFYVFVRLSSHREIKVLVACVMVGGVLQCLYAGMQGTGLLPSLHNAFPMTGSFLNPAPLAGYLAVLVCMLVACLFLGGRLQGKIRQLAWGSLLLFFLFVLLLNSRAALFATIVIMAVIGYSRLKLKRKKLYAGILIVGLGLSLYGLYQVREVSANGRLFIWKNTCEMIKDHPLTGVGIDRFKAEFPAYQAQYHSQLTQEAEKYYDGNTFLVFNEYLRALAETGFLLPLLFLLPLGIVWKYRNISVESRMAACGIGCLLVFGFFSYPFSILTLKVLMVLFLGMIGRECRVVYSWNRFNCIEWAVVGTTVACTAFSIYGLKVVSELDANDWKDKEHVFWFRDNIAFVRRHCQGALERGDTIQAVRILTDAIGRIPVAGFYQHRAKLYAETGDFQKAEKDYLFLRHLAPTSWNVVLELARLYHQMNRTWEALELLEPYTKISPKGKTLEQKALLLEIREFAILVKEVI
ncbi:MAG: O-antigen ligase family protein [Bacteroidaceae bacterium]|nr:O-antigen ligase family protein [Bacteroidaceae bacterium]